MNPLSDITAVVLAGGSGTRLRAAVADRPKVLAEVSGRPFLAYLLDQLADAGVGRVVLCTGYMADQVEAVFGSSFRNLELVYSVEDSALGTGGALRLALPLLACDPVLVCNGDSYFDTDLVRFAESHVASGGSASMLLVSVADADRYGAVELTEDGLVTSFSEKGLRRGEGVINAGIYLLPCSLIASIPEGCPVSLEREIFPVLAGQGLRGFTQNGAFIDIGIPSAYQAATAFFAAMTNRRRT